MRTDGNFFLSKMSEQDDNGFNKYSSALKSCILEAGEICLSSANNKDDLNPLMLLGRIQSGKTRAFVGLISLLFDNDFDLILILSKNSNALVLQTIKRLVQEYRKFEQDNEVVIQDITILPDEVLTDWQLNQKHIIVAKKETRNLDRIKIFIEKNSIEKNKKCLIIDDEADITSIGFEKKKGSGDIYFLRKIAEKIGNVRDYLGQCVFVQVTATPYALYLQPQFEQKECLPLKPYKTVLLPQGDGYIGGKFYFLENDPKSSCINEEFSEEEREFITDKLDDGRSYKEEKIFVEKRLETFLDAFFNFIVGGCVYREVKGDKNVLLAYLVHMNTQKNKHKLIHSLVDSIIKKIKNDKSDSMLDEIIKKRIKKAYENIKQSVLLYGFEMPVLHEIEKTFFAAIHVGEVSTRIVNSESEVKKIIDPETGELKLRTPFTILIGGQILDRGLTIKNLAGFFYGRDPKVMQTDTVMQHARMFGYRNNELLAITRFYATRNILERLVIIATTEEDLRKSIEKGVSGEGVYFIQRDNTGKVRPCAPSKIGMSQLVLVNAFSRTLPVGFSTVVKTKAQKPLREVEKIISNIFSDRKQHVVISFSKAREILKHCYDIIEGDEGSVRFISLENMLNILEHIEEDRNDLYLIVREDREVSKYKMDGNLLSDAPDSGKDERKIANDLAHEKPVLMILKQKGIKKLGWDDCEFWWPILMAPKSTKNSIMALDKPKGRLQRKN